MALQNKNHLIGEKSPYLLQHAANPVDWYPWGEEAFAKAKTENKPVFLSIGYSTCHWCHVMAHESFEDDSIAKILNEHFISIKVDREERPDIDNIYMMAVTALTGSGGWPLSVFLTPDKKPFYGGTYFPPIARWGSPGFRDLLLSISQTWQAQPAEILASSQSITDALQERTRRMVKDGKDPSVEMLQQAYREFSQHFDPRFGGFGQSPKFPMGHSLSFLLRYWQRTQDQEALHIVEHTLRQMMRGGIYDHLGGGFHRYATDQQWQVPHFEKMLYDQALLVKAYMECYQITQDKDYIQTAREVLDYVMRDMQSPQGGFYSAEDADSLDLEHNEKKEGAFYLWSKQEVSEVLAKDEVEILNYYFGVESSGNAQFDPHGEFVGKNILYVTHSIEETAHVFKRTPEDVQRIIAGSKKKLYAVRQKRPHPHLDDKVLTDWNGLMISALAISARASGESKYAASARKAADFILNTMRDDKGHLLHRYRDGEAAIRATLEDYAFFIHGLLDLYEATFEVNYLQEARTLTLEMIDLFWDQEQGGLFFTARDSEALLFRHKEVYDGAIPSGNSVALLVLARLSHMTFDDGLKEKVEGLLRVFISDVIAHPSAYAQFLIGLDFVLGPSEEIVISEGTDDHNAPEILKMINGKFLPRAVLLWRPSGKTSVQGIGKIAPFVNEQMSLNNKTTVYVCQDHVCQKPVNSLDELKKFLNKLTE